MYIMSGKTYVKNFNTRLKNKVELNNNLTCFAKDNLCIHKLQVFCLFEYQVYLFFKNFFLRF